MLPIATATVYEYPYWTLLGCVLLVGAMVLATREDEEAGATLFLAATMLFVFTIPATLLTRQTDLSEFWAGMLNAAIGAACVAVGYGLLLVFILVSTRNPKPKPINLERWE